MKTPAALSVLLAAATLLAAPLAAQIKLTGSVAVGALITKKQAAIEAASGQKIEVVTKNVAIGLREVCAGKTDLSMAVGPIGRLAAGANAEQPGSVDLAAVRTFEVGREQIYFVVHPGNPVKSVTLAQLKGIFTGAITNWSAVGGADAEIKLFAMTTATGARVVVDELVLHDAPLAPNAVLRATAKDIKPMVVQVPTAIGFLPAPSVDEDLAVLRTDRPVPMIMSINSKGEPTPAQKAVIDAVRAALN
ncbi:MAG: substrate-binding domain-containing protein [Opitutae bacterium]|nr:substrate-binding domain-containing protein [Opitutae bacterium]